MQCCPAADSNRVAAARPPPRCGHSTAMRFPMVSLTVPTDRIARGRAGVILFTTSLGVFIAQLDSQVVNLAVKDIGSDLNAGINQLQWVIDAYNLCYATLLLTGGTLGDLYGRMRVFVA